MAIKISNDSTIIRCSSCSKKFDLTKAANKAETQGSREIRCPHCNHYSGKIN